LCGDALKRRRSGYRRNASLRLRSVTFLVQGTATNAPAATPVYLYWRDATAGQVRYTLEPATVTSDANGTWRNYITHANINHQYVVYVRYDVATSASCLYGGTGHFSSCP